MTSCLDDVEYADDYRPGGFHPVAINDLFIEGRYRAVRKLGSGGTPSGLPVLTSKAYLETRDYQSHAR